MKWLLSCLLGCLLTLHAGAALVAYEGFNGLPDGSQMKGQRSGFGFTGAWRKSVDFASKPKKYRASASGLSYGQLATGGGAVTNTSSAFRISDLSRTLSQPLGRKETTSYFSFLLEPRGVLHVGSFGGYFGLVLDTARTDLFFGKVGSQSFYGIEDRGGSGRFLSSVPVELEITVLLVVKAEFGADGDIFTLYVNPVPGEAEPSSGIVKSGTNIGKVTALTMFSSGAYALDEIRAGETYADVVPIPEPSTLTVLVGVFAVSCFRRRNTAQRG